MSGRRVFVIVTQECREPHSQGCLVRWFDAAEGKLYVCPCECHDAGETKPPAPTPSRREIISAWASEIGKRGGRKGGRARAKTLSPERRTAIGVQGAKVRWSKPKA